MTSRYVTIFFLFFLYTFNFYANELKNETSPYLLQHANNPVNWMPWGEEAFKKAKKEHKAVFVSIGYSTCHWCHVMEKESFSNPKIAALLNRYFISVKIDREELPQIDSLYQKKYKYHYGHAGGWPLNLFLTEDKKLFYITNYIPPYHERYAEGFDTLLVKLHRIYQDKKLLKKNIDKYHVQKASSSQTAIDFLSLKSLQNSIKQEYEGDFFGFGKSREFPEASKAMLMLDLAQLTDDRDLQKNYFDMLDVMALRGLYDHVNGGFFRYCVDTNWEIPHFEKMLYTQAELIPLYVRAYALKKKELYKSVVSETFNMLKSRFEKNSLYWSASDADVKEREGEFFTFTQKQIKEALQANPYAKEIEEAMEFSYDGNFHERVHINFYTEKRPKGFAEFQKALQKIAEKKEYPFIDKKINTAWNSMMIEALYKASVLDEKYIKTADEHLLALSDLMFDKGELYHQTILGQSPKQKALLEDYAFFIGALISAYEADFNEDKLDFANYLLLQAKRKFYKDGVWYFTQKQQIEADLNDRYYTSAQSKMIQNILDMAALKASFEYEKLADKSLHHLMNILITKKSQTPALARAYLMKQKGVVVIKSSKENLKSNVLLIEAIDYPYLVKKSKEYNDFLACTLRQCFAKEEKLSKLIQKIEQFSK